MIILIILNNLFVADIWHSIIFCENVLACPKVTSKLLADMIF